MSTDLYKIRGGSTQTVYFPTNNRRSGYKNFSKNTFADYFGNQSLVTNFIKNLAKKEKSKKELCKSPCTDLATYQSLAKVFFEGVAWETVESCLDAKTLAGLANIKKIHTAAYKDIGVMDFTYHLSHCWLLNNLLNIGFPARFEACPAYNINFDVASIYSDMCPPTHAYDVLYAYKFLFRILGWDMNAFNPEMPFLSASVDALDTYPKDFNQWGGDTSSKYVAPSELIMNLKIAAVQNIPPYGSSKWKSKSAEWWATDSAVVRVASYYASQKQIPILHATSYSFDVIAGFIPNGGSISTTSTTY